MRVEETELPEALLTKLDPFVDERGFFIETYSEPKYRQLGINASFVQDNLSFSISRVYLEGCISKTEMVGQNWTPT